ncbi:MAG: hypothetical protein U0166_01535 [Acidobacteriota bacterium]
MNKREREPRLGVDIGRVLMCPAGDDGRPDTSFLDGDERQALAVPAAPHLYEVLPGVVRSFEQRVWLVSKAGPRIERLTLRWLHHHDFYRRTGLRQDRVRFCRRREDKREHALVLGLTHFIDDRPDVLEHLRGVVANLFLFGAQRQLAPDWTVPVRDWLAVAAALSRGGDGEPVGPPAIRSGATASTP